MQLNSQQPPVYFPDCDQSTVLRLGLQTLAPEQWIHIDGDFPHFRRHKLDTVQRLGKRVYQALDESIPAQRELHSVLLHHLPRQYPNLYRLENGSLLFHSQQTDSVDHFSDLAHHGDMNPLWRCSLWIPEDLCILEQREGNYTLTAASLCSPSNWKLEEKLGKPLDLIHQVVPDYQSQLSARVNRLFAGLKADKPILRYNWSIQPGNELCWRDDFPPCAEGAFPDAQESLHSAGGSQHVVDGAQSSADAGKYWRVERQTLRRLPVTGAIVFTIRIYLYSFSIMAQFPDFAPFLQGILARLPANQKKYKGL